jgi:predicted RNA binding protein YcfA (HicA-like mRNA interferase family)
MIRAPRITGGTVIASLHKAGFRVVRVKGSHHFLKHPDGRCTVVPVHKGETIGVGLLARILHDAELSIHEFRQLQ